MLRAMPRLQVVRSHIQVDVPSMRLRSSGMAVTSTASRTMMSAAEKYLFDLNGYIVVKGVFRCASQYWLDAGLRIVCVAAVRQC